MTSAIRSLFRPTYFSALLLAGAGAFAQQAPVPAAVGAPNAQTAAPGAMPSPPPAADAADRAAPGVMRRGRPGAPPVADGRGPRRGSMEQGVTQTVNGRMQQWLINPNGEADGFLLSDGTQVNFPPHLSAKAMQMVKPGDSVQISGSKLVANGAIRAQRVTVAGTNREIVDQGPDVNAAPPAPRDPAALVAINASGVVSRVLYTDRGNANGVILDNGAIVRFPPNAVTTGDLLRPGTNVVARGWGTRSGQGTALEATAIGASADKMTELFAGPGAMPQPMRPVPAPVTPAS